MSALHDKHFPGETSEYREKRNRLLESEIELRRKIEEVAEQRRKLPMGGKVKEDYVFEEMDGQEEAVNKVKLSELFAPGKDSLILYSFMFHPKDISPCTSCSSILDGINGMVYHALDRVNLVAVAKAPIRKFKTWADSKGWSNLRLLSSYNNSYNTDYNAENAKGSQLPLLSVFHKKGNDVHHFYSTELLYVKPEPGQDGRHVDMIWPLWNLFDYTPEGRGANWHPKHKYEN